MGHDDGRERGCARRRLGALRRWWTHVVHACVHPVSATAVLLSAAVEVFEWLKHGAEHALHLILPLFMAGGH